MAIDPKLVSIKKAGDLPSGIPTDEGKFLYYEANKLMKAEMGDLYDRLESAYLGIITPSSTIPATGSWYGTVLAEGTFNNVTPAITVDAADFDVENGMANNEVRIIISDGVATKDVRRVKGDVGPAGFDVLKVNETIIPLTVTNYYLTPTGTLVANSTWRTSQLIDVVDGQKYHLIADTSPVSADTPAMVGYDSSGAFVSVLLPKGNYSAGTEIIIPAGVSKIRTSSYQTTTLALKLLQDFVDEKYLQNKKADTFDPNDDVDFQTGKSIADYFIENVYEEKSTTFLNGYLNSTGVFVANGNFRTDENFIDVNEGEIWQYKGSTVMGGSSRSVVGYDASNAFVAVLVGIGDYWTSPTLFTIPAGVTKIRSAGHVDTPPSVSLQKKMVKESMTQAVVGDTGKGKIKMNKSWGAVGTSITSQDGALQGYQTRIKDVFEFTNYSNYGYSGNSLGGTTTGDTSSILATAKTDTWTAKDIFTMESITNDFKRDIPIGTVADYDNNTGITTYYGALRVFKDKVLSLNANAIVIVANALKRNNGGYTSTSTNTAGHTLLDYEKALLYVALQNNWKFIDQNRESGINDDNLAYTTSDGLHPNNFGYRLISKVWIREFWLLSKTNP